MDLRIGKTTLGLPVADLAKGHGQLGMNRMNAKHFSGSEVAGLLNIPMNSESILVDTDAQPTEFVQMMMNALNEASQSQNEVDRLTQQAIVDPDSVNVHDVSIAMAKANMTLSVSKAIIDRTVTGFKDILNQR